MPEYLAPGVYVEETSFRSKSIEGVGTSTTAFVGPTRRGPIGGTPELVTSLPDFERLYGSLANLEFGDVPDPSRQLNFVAHAARAYFENGGALLYIARTSNSTRSAPFAQPPAVSLGKRSIVRDRSSAVLDDSRLRAGPRRGLGVRAPENAARVDDDSRGVQRHCRRLSACSVASLTEGDRDQKRW